MQHFDVFFAEKHEPLPEGFAQFNQPCRHLCIDVPDDICTISLKLSSGKLMTLGFVPYGGKTAPQCCDIVVHNSGGTTKNGDKEIPTMEFSAYTPGVPVFTAKHSDDRPITLLALNLQEK